jgi:hypothetical protein
MAKPPACGGVRIGWSSVSRVIRIAEASCARMARLAAARLYLITGPFYREGLTKWRLEHRRGRLNSDETVEGLVPPSGQRPDALLFKSRNYLPVKVCPYCFH